MGLSSFSMSSLYQSDETQAAELNAELSRLLQSAIFQQAPRSRMFLEYVVQQAIANPDARPKEYTIAVEVFGCDPTYDSSVDATVRVEAGRLRNRLREYYATDGKEDRWIIDVPKGGYRATFQERPASLDAPIPVMPVPPQAMAPDQQEPRRFAGGKSIALVLAILLVLAGSVWQLSKTRRARVQGSTTEIFIQQFANLTTESKEDGTAILMTQDLARLFAPVLNVTIIDAPTGKQDHSSAGSDASGKTSPRRVRVSGTLRLNADDHLALSMQVANAVNDVIVLDREYLLELPDTRPVEAEAFGDILQALRIDSDASMMRQAGSAHPISQESLTQFKYAEDLRRNENPQDLHKSIDALDAIVARNPRYAAAWAALAEAHVLLGLYFEPPRDHMPKARLAAEQAIALDSSLQEAHGTLGVIHLFYDWDYPAARAEVRNAEADAQAIHQLACFSHLLERTGSERRAEEEILRLLAYDPRSPALISELGCIDYYRRQYQNAVGHYQQALKANPKSGLATWGLAKSLGQMGRYSEALHVIQAFRQANAAEPPFLTTEAGYLEGRSGHVAEARKAIQQLGTESQAIFVDPYFIALIYHSFHQEDQTYAYLQKALAMRSPFMVSLNTDPKWADAAHDPRFISLLHQLHQT